MTIAISGSGASTIWVNNLGVNTLACDFGSVQANAMLVMATTITSLDTFPNYVYDVQDSRGNKWYPLAAIDINSWVATGQFEAGNGNIPLVTQLWYALDTSSPATGYTVTAHVKSMYTDDSGAPHAMQMDAGGMALLRVSGVNFSDPFDTSPLSGAVSFINQSTQTNPTQTNTIASDTTNIAIIAAYGTVGGLQGAHINTNFTNNGNTWVSIGKLRQDVNGASGGGPAHNAMNIVLDICTAAGQAGSPAAIGPWNHGSNTVQNENTMKCCEMITRIITADTHPIRKRVKARSIA